VPKKQRKKAVDIAALQRRLPQPDFFGLGTRRSGARVQQLQASNARQVFVKDLFGHSKNPPNCRRVFLFWDRLCALADGSRAGVPELLNRVAATVDLLGNRMTTVYDTAGRVSATENALGHFVAAIYDSYGRTVASEDSLSHFTTTVFDSYGRQMAGPCWQAARQARLTQEAQASLKRLAR
jgi:YD repeat-containing protein